MTLTLAFTKPENAMFLCTRMLTCFHTVENTAEVSPTRLPFYVLQCFSLWITWLKIERCVTKLSAAGYTKNKFGKPSSHRTLAHSWFISFLMVVRLEWFGRTMSADLPIALTSAAKSPAHSTTFWSFLAAASRAPGLIRFHNS